MTPTPTLYRHVSSALLLIGLIWMLPWTTQAHLAMIYPPCRGSPIDKPQYDGKAHCFIGFEEARTLPCNGYNSPGPGTALRAGQQVDVNARCIIIRPIFLPFGLFKSNGFFFFYSHLFSFSFHSPVHFVYVKKRFVSGAQPCPIKTWSGCHRGRVWAVVFSS